MSTLIRLLSLVLVIQLGLTASLQVSKSGAGTFTGDTPLLPLSLEEIDSITIEEPEKESLSIVKKDDIWKIQSMDDYPASLNKLAVFGDTLFNLKRPYPVGNTAIAANNFSLSDENYKKKITFKQGATVKGTLFIGSSPGFKKLHVRVNEETKSYAAPLATHQFDSNSQQWLEKDLIKIDRSELKELSLKNIKISLAGNKPQLADIPEGKMLDEEKANTAIKDLTRINFTKLLGTEDTGEYAEDKAAIEYTANTGERTVTYTIKQQKEGDEYVLKRSDLPYYFSISKYPAEKIEALSKESLLKEIMEEKENESEKMAEGKQR